MDVLEALFEAPAELRQDLAGFYGDLLGLEALESDHLLGVNVGGGRLTFRAAAGSAPFYHFALLVPGNRFREAYTWLSARTPLLPDPGTGETDFDFDNWDAHACYCLDPAGSILELIAHRGLAETTSEGPFDGGELAGFSEIGLVGGDKHEIAALLAREFDLQAWDGELDDPRRLAFVGERGRTLILCPAGRGWLPTGRPAEVHGVELVLAGPRDAKITVPGTPQRVTSRRRDPS
jgi:hypothetical protein